MLRVGLTGGIGCGKTVVAEAFAALGIPVIDTDVIAHQLTATDGVALQAIRASLGDAVFLPDGRLDRSAVRRRIFSDASERHKLESILHPLILQAVQQQLQTIPVVPYVLVVVPLLLETASYLEMVDRVLVVDCLKAQQLERVIARNKLKVSEIQAITAAQADRSTRLAGADDVLANTGDRAFLQQQITPLHNKYLELARKQL